MADRPDTMAVATGAEERGITGRLTEDGKVELTCAECERVVARYSLSSAAGSFARVHLREHQREEQGND